MPTPVYFAVVKVIQSYQHLTDQELADQYRITASQPLLATLFERYRDLVFGLCYKYLQDSDLAADACNDIYIELVTKLQKHEVEYPKSWLYSLARNHCLMKLRKKKQLLVAEFTENLMQSEEGWHPNTEMQEKEARLNALEDCISKLKEEQQQAVQLFYIQEKCYNEISEITGLEWNTIRSQIQNGRRNLKICMENHESN